MVQLGALVPMGVLIQLAFWSVGRDPCVDEWRIDSMRPMAALVSLGVLRASLPMRPINAPINQYVTSQANDRIESPNKQNESTSANRSSAHQAIHTVAPLQNLGEPRSPKGQGAPNQNQAPEKNPPAPQETLPPRGNSDLRPPPDRAFPVKSHPSPTAFMKPPEHAAKRPLPLPTSPHPRTSPVPKAASQSRPADQSWHHNPKARDSPQAVLRLPQ
jgi:hypothetical protein